jgi:hypothetical protein
VLSHHENWLPGFWLPGFSVDTGVTPIRDEPANVAPQAKLLELDQLDATEVLPWTGLVSAGCRCPSVNP